ncbi:MAG: hypothetical protein MUF31_09525 [Akkermansiaceae bacterium]|jgi:hypothetical protein|nr:hypothetical protein [Akkermansiaceae bacterium]
MANIFAIITAVLLAASAYVAYKNKTAYEGEIQARVDAEALLGRQQARLAGLVSDRDSTISTRTGVEEDTAGKREEQEAAESANAKLKADIEEKREEVKSNGEKLDEIKQQTAELGEISEIAPKITRLRDQITALRDERDSKQAVLANTLAQRNSTQGRIDQYVDENGKVSRQQSFFSSARIRAIFPSYGFVTLSAGNSAGVVSGSTLDVVRGGETVAQLRVRTVESGSASADIVPDSLSEDVTLMVGDLVKPAAPKQAAPAPAPAAAAADADADEDAAEEEPADSEEEAPAEEEATEDADADPF